MVKYLFLFFYAVFPLFASSYYAKVEPVDIYTIASKVQGEVLFADENMVGKKLSDKPFIIIDAKTDKADLEALKVKRKTLRDLIEANKEIVQNLQESMELKKRNYESIKNLTVKSKTQKDAIYYDFLNTKNQLLNTKKELLNFTSQEADLTAKQVRLEKTIADKTIHEPGLILYELYVKKNDVATPGKPLAKVADTSKAILTIFVDKETLKGIKQKKVYLDGVETAYKVDRVTPIADSVNISKYKVQIIIDAPKIFSKLVKVELK